MLDHVGRQRTAAAVQRSLSRRGTTTYDLLSRPTDADAASSLGRLDSTQLRRSASPAITRSNSNLKVRVINENNTEGYSNEASSDCEAKATNNRSDVGSVVNSHRARTAAKMVRNRIERAYSGTYDILSGSGVLALPPTQLSDAPPFSSPKETVDSEVSLMSTEFDFRPVEPIPPRPEELKDAHSALKMFAAIAGQDPLVYSQTPILPQRYFYGRRLRTTKRGSSILKCKVVDVGPDTPKLQLPAYVARLIQLVKDRRCRLAQIEAGACMFRHENKIILEHELKEYEKGLKNAMKMLRDTSMDPREPVTARADHSHVLSTKVLRPATGHAIMRGKQVNFSLEEFMADISVSGISDLLTTSSDVTSVLEEEVEELRKSLRKVREDIAYILEEEDELDDEPPLQHIKANRQCSIHSLSSA